MPKRILLADDSITIQKVVELTFSDGDYEVIATNNGAKAIQKLAEMRPDIILSDIIMPEKNGYEVCEYVKSHPELRGIPVILLTGTFEPFDPDRAEKAGCDAVVTKPFESQSLVNKVEELIQQSRAHGSGAAAIEQTPSASPLAEPSVPISSPAQEETPFEGESPFAPPAPAIESSPSAATSSAAAAEESPFAPISPAAPEEESPFAPISPAPPVEDSPFAPVSSAPAAEESPFAPVSSAPAAEESPFAPTSPSAPPPAFATHSNEIFAPVQETTVRQPIPFEEPPAFSGETRAFPRLSFEDLERMAADTGPEPADFAPPPPPAGLSPETRTLPKFSFDDLQSTAEEPVSPAPPPAVPAATPPEEMPGFSGASGETRAMPSFSFDDVEKPSAAPVAEPAPVPVAPVMETRVYPVLNLDEAPTQSAPPPTPASETAAATSPWEDEPEPAPLPAASAAAGAEEESPFEAPHAAEAIPFASAPSPEPAWPASPAASAESPWDEAEAEAEPVPPPPVVAAPEPAAFFETGGSAAQPSATTDLTEAQIDRIARRVVELMSEQVVRNIAWEIVPDLAELIVKQRIKELESEA